MTGAAGSIASKAEELAHSLPVILETAHATISERQNNLAGGPQFDLGRIAGQATVLSLASREERAKIVVEEILRQPLPPPTVRKLDRAQAKTRDGRFFALWVMGNVADNRVLMVLP